MQPNREDCPKCGNTDTNEVAVSNIDGYECMKCGCWFDRDETDGSVRFAYESHPLEI
ncbi:hypothetical protein EHM76_00310 [bacterium]|nr:MAG: hypothetical protein EHM76_00310 [bacterium]